jgi:hypothetical protein
LTFAAAGSPLVNDGGTFAGGVFTAPATPATGQRWYFSAALTFTGIPNGAPDDVSLTIQLQKNNVLAYSTATVLDSTLTANTTYTVPVSAVIDVVPNDTVRVAVTNGSTATVNIIIGSSFSGFLAYVV